MDPDQIPFSVHWSPVSADGVEGHVPAGVRLFALWPAPVNPDECFRDAGFTVFGDADSVWDEEAEALLTRLLAELGRFGSPALRSAPLLKDRPWYLAPFREPEPLPLREQIEQPQHWDNLPECVVAFGDGGATLRVGSGHQLYWVTLPERDAAVFGELVNRVAGPHPVVRTELRWRSLWPALARHR